MRNLNKTMLPFLLACILVFNSCKKDDNTTPARTIADVEKDFKALDISPGIHDVVLQMLNGQSYTFRIIAPVRAVGEKRPLVMSLHGASGGNQEAYKATCLVEAGLVSLKTFIISPYGNNGLWYEPFYEQEVLTLLDLAKRFWPIEVNKTAVTGYSNGGNGSWYFADTKPAAFAAAIPMASSYNILNPNGSGRKVNIPLYVIHGQTDELFPVAQTQAWVQASQAAGSNITWVVAPGLGHYVPCNYTLYLQQAANWLKNTIWL